MANPRRRSPPRLLTVTNNILLTPHMRRVTLGGKDMAGFPEGSESANFKLLLPRDGQDIPVLSMGSDMTDSQEKPIVRNLYGSKT